METNKSTMIKAASRADGCEYCLAVIDKTDIENVYGVAARDTFDDNILCIKEIGADKELALSIVDILNKYRIPYVHFIDVINDLMNE